MARTTRKNGKQLWGPNANLANEIQVLPRHPPREDIERKGRLLLVFVNVHPSGGYGALSGRRTYYEKGSFYCEGGDGRGTAAVRSTVVSTSRG